MDEAEWIEAFARTATALYPDGPETVILVVARERARRKPGVIIDDPEMFLSPLVRNAWRNTLMATLGQIQPESDLPPDLRLLREIGGNFPLPGKAASPDLEKTIHNERMKLNANFLNSLAVWFAGAGSAGGLISTFMASSHDFAGAGEVAAIGLIFAVVLEMLANRAIGKLR